MDNQLRELLTGYGEIAGIWFDGWWDRPDANWHLDRTYGLIHSLQPAALIGNNHHRLPFPGEDFQMFEKDLPGHKTADFNTTSEVGQAAARDLRHHQQRVGLQQDRQALQEHRAAHSVSGARRGLQRQLSAEHWADAHRKDPAGVRGTSARNGQWLDHNGESIYGTHGGPIAPSSWGATTQRPGKIYVHVMDYDGRPARAFEASRGEGRQDAGVRRAGRRLRREGRHRPAPSRRRATKRTP